jgi:hypothetical protein
MISEAIAVMAIEFRSNRVVTGAESGGSFEQPFSSGS